MDVVILVIIKTYILILLSTACLYGDRLGMATPTLKGT